jgi:hypothetical protein
VNPSLRAITAINLSSFYSKQNLDFRGVCVLTEALSSLPHENLWEKSMILLNLGKLKSSLNYSQDSLSDLLESLNLLQKIPSKDQNFFTVLIVLHFNLSVEFSKLFKFSESEKHLALAKSLSFENLSEENKLFKFFSQKKSESRPSRASPYKSPRNLPMSTRSKSSLKDGKTIYKKFDKISQSFDLVTANKERIKKIKKFQPPLEALLEEDECFNTSFPNFYLGTCRSWKENEESVLRKSLNRDPDPEPVVKDFGSHQEDSKRRGKRMKKYFNSEDFSNEDREKGKAEGVKARKHHEKSEKKIEKNSGRLRVDRELRNIYKSRESGF